MSAITTHVLDTSSGRPAAGIDIKLDALRDGTWEPRGAGTTDTDGRLGGLLSEGELLVAGTWRLTFETGPWFEARGTTCFYPQVQVVFAVSEPSTHHHVPLLLSPFGYSTYRGS